MTTITPWKDGNKEAIKIKAKGVSEIRDTYLKVNYQLTNSLFLL